MSINLLKGSSFRACFRRLCPYGASLSITREVEAEGGFTHRSIWDSMAPSFEGVLDISFCGPIFSQCDGLDG